MITHNSPLYENISSVNQVRQGAAWRLKVVCCHGDGEVVGRVGAQVLEGLLALGDELFERREQQLGGRRAPQSVAFRRGDLVVPLRVGEILQAGAAFVGGLRALRASGAPTGSRVEAAAAARATVHGLQEEAVGGAPAGRAVGRQVLLVQEVLHLLRRHLLQLKHTTWVMEALLRLGEGVLMTSCHYIKPYPLWTHHVVERRGVDQQLQEDLGEFLQVPEHLLNLGRQLSDLLNRSQLGQRRRSVHDPPQGGPPETLCSVQQRHHQVLKVLQQLPGQSQHPAQTHLQAHGSGEPFLTSLHNLLVSKTHV